MVTPYLRSYGKWQSACIIHISVVQLPTHPRGSNQNAHHCKSKKGEYKGMGDSLRKETTNLTFLISLDRASMAFGAFAFACTLLLLLTEIVQSSLGYAVECTHSFSQTLNPSTFANAIWNFERTPRHINKCHFSILQTSRLPQHLCIPRCHLLGFPGVCDMDLFLDLTHVQTSQRYNVPPFVGAIFVVCEGSCETKSFTWIVDN